jgi:hypothetical protein
LASRQPLGQLAPVELEARPPASAGLRALGGLTLRVLAGVIYGLLEAERGG